MLKLFPKASNMRLTYDILLNFLNALLDDKIDINHIISEELQQKFNDSILSRGAAHELNSDMQVMFDNELRENFDKESIKSIKHILESNFIVLLTNFSFRRGDYRRQKSPSFEWNDKLNGRRGSKEYQEEKVLSLLLVSTLYNMM